MKTMRILAAVAIIAFISAFTTPGSGYKVGDVATDFKLKNVDGKMVSLSDYKSAKGFIVVFTCNHCPFAKAYEDRIIALDKKYAKLGYPVIAINPNNPEKQKEDSFALMQARAKEKGFTFPYLFDEGQKIYPQYGATKTPHVYILQKTAKGNEVKYIGAIDDNHEEPSAVKEKYAENALDALLRGQPVKVTETKAIGCSIKA
ncbi:MAG: thioredoxin family protein [Flavobacterium sp.]|uniref:thioredoxin family protein n=1 Tax=Flavobacterium sp. TaxID=239 RepID=UPI001223C2B9|nr:thioredoxin family protein [Flavobacterium sp.]RZJ65712.1 MAG: thioredoxin family protein [Flavobacterium sp.]